MRVTVMPIITGTIPKCFETELARVDCRKTNWNYPGYSIPKINQNAEKSFEDFRRLVVTQTPVENYQQTLVWRTRKEWNANYNDNNTLVWKTLKGVNKMNRSCKIVSLAVTTDHWVKLFQRIKNIYGTWG